MKLKPCPFCGETSELGITLRNVDGFDSYGVYCASCDIWCGDEYFTEKDAVDTWNNRPSCGAKSK